jgi:hypothetical protein
MSYGMSKNQTGRGQDSVTSPQTHHDSSFFQPRFARKLDLEVGLFWDVEGGCDGQVS